MAGGWRLAPAGGSSQSSSEWGGWWDSCWLLSCGPLPLWALCLEAGLWLVTAAVLAQSCWLMAAASSLKLPTCGCLWLPHTGQVPASRAGRLGSQVGPQGCVGAAALSEAPAAPGLWVLPQKAGPALLCPRCRGAGRQPAGHCETGAEASLDTKPRLGVSRAGSGFGICSFSRKLWTLRVQDS